MSLSTAAIRGTRQQGVASESFPAPAAADSGECDHAEPFVYAAMQDIVPCSQRCEMMAGAHPRVEQRGVKHVPAVAFGDAVSLDHRDRF
jgi:hypothetical protein